MKVDLKDFDLKCQTDCQAYDNFEVGEVVFDSDSVNGCKSIGIIMAIYTNYGITYRLNSVGCQSNVSKCPDDIAEKALLLLKKGWLAYETPNGSVVCYNEAVSL